MWTPTCVEERIFVISTFMLVSNKTWGRWLFELSLSLLSSWNFACLPFETEHRWHLFMRFFTENKAFLSPKAMSWEHRYWINKSCEKKTNKSLDCFCKPGEVFSKILTQWWCELKVQGITKVIITLSEVGYARLQYISILVQVMALLTPYSNTACLLYTQNSCRSYICQCFQT